MQLVIGSTYESSRGFGRLLYLGETHGIDGYLPTFRTTKGKFKHYSYDRLPGALVEFASPTVSRADELIACLEGEIAKRDARILELESQYQRDVYGLNNEGDPIGGDPAGGYASDNARLRSELAAIKAQEPVEYQQWSRYENWDRVDKAVFELGLLSSTPERFRALYAAPVSEAKAQGVVMPEPMKRGDEGLPEFLTQELEAVGQEAVAKAVDDQCSSVPVLQAVYGEAIRKRVVDDAQAVDDGLRGEVADLLSMLATVSKAGLRVRTERDQQAQRIGELEGLLLRVQVSLSLDDTEWGYSGAEKYKLLADIRAALSAGKEVE